MNPTPTDSAAEPVKVVFRVWRTKAGRVLALFPAIASTVGRPDLCDSFALQEGHGGADYYGCMRRTRPATPAEYQNTLTALTRNYGYQLRIVRRGSRSDYLARVKQLARSV